MSSCRIPWSLVVSLGWIFLVGFLQFAVGASLLPLSAHLGNGRVLIHELNCVACHEGRADRDLPPRGAPNLSEAGSRLHSDWLRAFLLHPAKVSPGTAHPSFLAGFSDSEASDRAEAIVQYLSMMKSTKSPEEDLRGNANAGQKLFNELGCIACHGAMEEVKWKTKYSSHRSLAEFLANPIGLNRHSRMPSLGLSSQEALDIATALLGGGEPLPFNGKPTPIVADFDKVKRGKILFSELNCGACHAVEPNGKLVPPEGILGPPLALAEMSDAAGRGCLSVKPSETTPHFRLTPNQVKVIASYLGKLPVPLKESEKLDFSLLVYGCRKCHERDGIGGPSEAREPYFLTTQQAMGPEGRFPPHLNGVGAKLKPGWLKEVISKGTKVRPYVVTRMPQYGDSVAVKLTQSFLAVDEVGISVLPEIEISQREALKHGRHLVGSKGMACVSCHTFAGIPSQGIQGMDLNVMNKRLRSDWFRRYLVNPSALRPGTRMPSFWPEGQSTKPEVLDGDTAKQIAAILSYLSLGSEAPLPGGLARSSMQLSVVDEARLYRNFIEGAGVRAIGVGYPGEVNLAWDANQLRPAILWRGSFMDASRHWSGRGQGFQAPDGYGRLSLPEGPPLAGLKNAWDPWPKSDGRSGDFRFRGYVLDKQRRPTFRYSFGDLRVEDFFKEIEQGDGRDFAFERTLTITGSMPSGLYLRAASGGSLKSLGDDAFMAGDLSLRLFCPEGSKIIPREKHGDVLISIRPSDEKFVSKQIFEW